MVYLAIALPIIMRVVDFSTFAFTNLRTICCIFDLPKDAPSNFGRDFIFVCHFLRFCTNKSKMFSIIFHSATIAPHLK